MTIKTVGELIKFLSKYPKNTEFCEDSLGYFCVHRRKYVYVEESSEPLSDVRNGKVIKLSKNGKLRLYIN